MTQIVNFLLEHHADAPCFKQPAAPMRDPILARLLPAMTEMYPAARVTETQAGHFLQEEVPVEIAAAIERVAAAAAGE